MRTTVAHTITFGAHGNAVKFQAFGWWGPEETWTWTAGAKSAIVFDAPDAPFGYFVEVDAGCLTQWPSRESQPVVVWANDRRVAAFDMRQDCTFAIFCPSPRENEGCIVLTFEHQGAIRLADLCENSDPRELALSFRSIRILVLLEPPAQLIVGRQVRREIRAENIAQAIDAAERTVEVPIHELLTSFEMLCGDCWFGLVQRILGSEPLGLLRFAGAVPRVTIKGLDTEFSEMGADINPTPAGDGTDEWMITDAFGLCYHSGKSLSVPPEKVIEMERKKVGFLRRKFSEDLTEARKTFVFSDKEGLPVEAALSLFLALRRSSKGNLLWVRPARSIPEAGTAREIAPGFVVGFLDFCGEPMSGNIPLGGWLSVLSSAYLLTATGGFTSSCERA